MSDSGPGELPYHSMIWVGEENFSVDEQYQLLCNEASHAGGIVFFVGLVRDLYADASNSESVEYIELEHYAGMTERLCAEIVDQASKRFQFDAARVLHRVGKLYSGDQIVMVAVASRHRQDAFEASQFIMDYLKTRATFWKREVGSRGANWLGIKNQDKTAVERWSK